MAAAWVLGPLSMVAILWAAVLVGFLLGWLCRNELGR